MKSDEIARLSGVSRTTVSRVVNNAPGVTEETRKKVMEIIDKFGYVPNTSAKTLAGKPQNTVGLFIISISEKNPANRIWQNSFFAPYMEIIVDALTSKGYYALVNVIYSANDFQKIKHAFLESRVDCGIIVGTELHSDVFSDILSRGYPMAIIDLDPGETRHFRKRNAHLTIVNSMDYEGACEAVEYLISIGHTDIGLLSGRLSTWSGRERYQAFVDTMKKNNLPIREEFVLQGEFLKEPTLREVTRMVNKGTLPSAIFAANDVMALAAMDVFKSRGIKVPADISIIGFDDITVAAQVTPSLSSVRVPFYEMGNKAVDAVIYAMTSADKSLNNIVLPVELVIRESCAPR